MPVIMKIKKKKMMCLLFLARLGQIHPKSAVKTKRAFREGLIYDRTICCWFQKLRSVDKDSWGSGVLWASICNWWSTCENTGWTKSTSKCQKIVSGKMGISISTISNHVKIIGKVKKLNKGFPDELCENQCPRCFKMCSILFPWKLNDPFLK